MEIKNTRCKKTLELFIEYCNNNPDQRFFQAVRNFIGIPFLLVSNVSPVKDQYDTFYWEDDDLIKE